MCGVGCPAMELVDKLYLRYIVSYVLVVPVVFHNDIICNNDVYP